MVGCGKNWCGLKRVVVIAGWAGCGGVGLVEGGEELFRSVVALDYRNRLLLPLPLQFFNPFPFDLLHPSRFLPPAP